MRGGSNTHASWEADVCFHFISFCFCFVLRGIHLIHQSYVKIVLILSNHARAVVPHYNN